jgi:hypothetical protein
MQMWDVKTQGLIEIMLYCDTNNHFSISVVIIDAKSVRPLLYICHTNFIIYLVMYLKWLPSMPSHILCLFHISKSQKWHALFIRALSASGFVLCLKWE